MERSRGAPRSLDLVGQALGPYQIVARIGAGGMGVVYKARKPPLRRLVAVKVLLGPRLAQPAARERFLREAATLADLDHPHVLPLYDYGEAEGVPYLVMPLVRGGTLRAWRGAPVPLERVVPLFARLLDALAYAHARRVVHRDLKPANVLLRSHDWPLLADFGLAKVLPTTPRGAGPGSLCGTPEYMAPEQWRRGPIDGRADLYALGIVLCELLTGQPLPTATDRAALAGRALRAARPDLARAWDEVVVRSLAADPRERFPSARAMAEAIAAAWEAGQRPGPVGRGRRRGRRATESSLEPDLGAGAAGPGQQPADVPRPHAVDEAPALLPLPQPLTPLVGRGPELAAVEALLARPEVRLVTLLGPPGIGKTRLALAAAAQARFPDGVHFVALDTVHDPALVVPAIAHALGLREQEQQPLDVALAEYLRPRRLLLLLDNCEQVVAAAPRVAGLLAAAPGVKALATSRVALRVHGEHQYAVPPLPLPGPDQLPAAGSLADDGAVALFLQRARALQPVFALTDATAPSVVAICALLEGVPLAIELAAAQVKLLSRAALAARLASGRVSLPPGPRDLPARHQTLRAAIGWSYDLLTAEERRLFRRLAVFSGGAPWEAIETVCYDSPEQAGAALVEVGALVDASLLQPAGSLPGASEPRFAILETLREYALERLAASGEAAVLHQRHLDYFLALATAAEGGLGGAERGAWLGRLEAEHGNLRAALAWSQTDAGDAASGLALAAVLWSFWYARGHLSEGRRWLAATLARAAAAPPTVRARALNSAGNLACAQGDYAEARARYAESLGLRETLGDRVAIAGSLNNLGMLAERLGDYPAATDYHTRSLGLRRALDDRAGVAASLDHLGTLAQRRGDYTAAASLHAEALELRRALDDVRGIAASLNNLGTVAELLGEHDRARALLEESLARFQQLDDPSGIAAALGNLGVVVGAQGDLARAAALQADSLRRFRDLGDSSGVAECLVALAGLVSRQDQLERAVRLLGAGEALWTQLGAAPPAPSRAVAEDILTRARSALGEGTVAAAWSAGQAMSAATAIDYALAPLSTDEFAALVSIS